jgi:hypothetical protein
MRRRQPYRLYEDRYPRGVVMAAIWRHRGWIWRLLALPLAPLALAHHGVSMFDRDKPIVVSGVVREFRWTSPHAWIVVDVPATTQAGAVQAADPAQWSFEGASIGILVRNGWKSSSLRAGDHVKVLAAPRRDGSHSGEFLAVTLTDSGKVLQLAGQ